MSSHEKHHKHESEDRNKALFVSFLGQSNAQFMSRLYTDYSPDSEDNKATGETVLKDVLEELTNYDVETNNFAVSSSIINGDAREVDEDRVWWHPETSEPGGALLDTVEELREWLPSPEDAEKAELAIVWGQGESDSRTIGSKGEEVAQQYGEGMDGVFDYLQDTLGDEFKLKFYVMQTGRYEEVPAIARGTDEEDIQDTQEGLEVIRDAQLEIALGRQDTALATDYSDLDLIYEEGLKYGEDYDLDEDRWSIDPWHVGHDSLQVTGNRLAEFIALDLQANHVLSFTNADGEPASEVSLPQAAILDLRIPQNTEIAEIVGTDAPDVIVGSFEADKIMGEEGKDIIIAGEGKDTLTGGEGSDIFIFDSSVTDDLIAHQDLITDFKTGLKGDRLDVQELFELVDSDGDDPITEHIRLEEINDSILEIQFDWDASGSDAPLTIARLEGVDLESFEDRITYHIIDAPS